MKKNERIAVLVGTLDADPASALDPRYQGFFRCFNSQLYYEAHDVLEDLWLETKGADHRFHKGLIQVAGAFVHLQKQHLHPSHAKHGRRLRPAVRLFHLAVENLAPFAPRHLHLDVAALCDLCRGYAAAAAADDFAQNPWSPAHAPQLRLQPS